MDQQSQQYSLQILGRDENGVQEEIGTITASEIGMYWVDTQRCGTGAFGQTE